MGEMSKVKHEEIIKRMTLEEKAFLMSGKNTWESKDYPKHNIPSIWMSDGPHGIRKQAGAADHIGLNESIKATCYPTAATMANAWDEELGEELGRNLGEEAAVQEVNILLGPGLNIKRSPLCGRNFEYFSEDPYLAGKMAASYIRGIQANGISACPKHFAVNSQEERRMTSNSVLDERTLREIYLTNFEIAVKEGKAKAIMSAYNEVNGVYANENKHLLRDILVDEWGFDGIVITDWGASNDHAFGVEAGSHLEMPGTGMDGAKIIIQAVEEGRLSEDVLDERVDEFLSVIFDVKKGTDNYKGKSFDVDAHHKVAMKAAEESIVLLKNEDNILPLEEGTRVAVIGEFADNPRYQGAGSSNVNPTKLDSVMDVINDSGLEVVGFARGYKRTGGDDPALLKEAVELARQADVVLLFVGLDESSESEGLDRAHMKMRDNQLRLIDAVTDINDKVVAVMSAGSPVEMPFIDKIEGLIHGYLSGQAGAGAMVNALTGKINPCGKLSETYPLKYEDTPAYNYYPGKERNSEYREGIFVGYRYYDTLDIPVLFPFGYGLSYTNFEYSDIKVDDKGVTFTITNTGEMDRANSATEQLSGFCSVDE